MEATVTDLKRANDALGNLLDESGSLRTTLGDSIDRADTAKKTIDALEAEVQAVAAHVVSIGENLARVDDAVSREQERLETKAIREKERRAAAEAAICKVLKSCPTDWFNYESDRKIFVSMTPYEVLHFRIINRPKPDEYEDEIAAIQSYVAHYGSSHLDLLVYHLEQGGDLHSFRKGSARPQ